MKPRDPFVLLTEEAIFDDSHLLDYMKEENWKAYRIEYDYHTGHGSILEGRIYLPPWVDPMEFEKWMRDHLKKPEETTDGS